MQELTAKPTPRALTLGAAERSRLNEISDEAYKQNTVYCPWKDIVAGRTNTPPDTPTRKEEASTGDIPRSVR